MPSRSIFFYLVKVCKDERCESEDSPSLLYRLVKYYDDLRKKNISELFYKADDRREMYMGLFNSSSIDVNEESINIIQGKIGYCLTELPEGEVDGQIIERINIEPDRARIYIPTHFVIFDIIMNNARTLVLGMEYNSIGPRHGKLANYLTYLLRKMMCIDINNCSVEHNIEIVPLYNKDLKSLLESLDKLKFIYIKVKTRYLEDIESKGILLSLLRGNILSSAKDYGSKTVTLELDSGRSKNKFINAIQPIDIIDLLNELSADAFVKIRLKAINKEGIYVKINDLLSKFIKDEVNVEYADNLTRRVNSTTMFKAIIQSFIKLFDTIIANAFI